MTPIIYDQSEPVSESVDMEQTPQISMSVCDAYYYWGGPISGLASLVG